MREQVCIAHALHPPGWGLGFWILGSDGRESRASSRAPDSRTVTAARHSASRGFNRHGDRVLRAHERESPFDGVLLMSWLRSIAIISSPPASGRYVKNSAAWLANFERFGNDVLATSLKKAK